MSKTTNEPQLQNWHNFCHYHANADWYGIWTKYSPAGDVIESFQGVRSFQVSEDGCEIHHQNHYTYTDGTKESKTFGPYKKPITKALFLDHSFFWGSPKLEPRANFAFETGFRHEDRRTSMGVVCNNRGKLQRTTVISEQLGHFSEALPNLSAKELCVNWIGHQKTITPDWIVSAPVATSWKPIEQLIEDYLTLHLPNNVSISYPESIESGQEFLFVVDWLASPTVLHRGICHYDASGFTRFTLEVFSNGE
jgi:hypothetical protein